MREFASTSIMKSILLAFALTALSTCFYAQAQTNDCLLFEVNREFIGIHNGEGVKDVKLKFKISVTGELLDEFKNTPKGHNGWNTFYCRGGQLKGSEGSTEFMWWVYKTQDNRWCFNLWGEGIETIHGIKIHAMNPCQQRVTFKQLEDLDMQYWLTYLNRDMTNGTPCGMNVSFSAKYVSAKLIGNGTTTPSISVKKLNESELFKGDDLSKYPLELRAGFTSD